MEHTDNDAYKLYLKCMLSNNSKPLSESEWQSNVDKLEPIDIETLAPRLKELEEKGEIIINGFRFFDKDGHEITDENEPFCFVDIDFSPGKNIRHPFPIPKQSTN
ncbi:hypothetical protein ES705_22576 [subsurface metagenome]